MLTERHSHSYKYTHSHLDTNTRAARNRRIRQRSPALHRRIANRAIQSIYFYRYNSERIPDTEYLHALLKNTPIHCHRAQSSRTPTHSSTETSTHLLSSLVSNTNFPLFLLTFQYGPLLKVWTHGLLRLSINVTATVSRSDFYRSAATIATPLLARQTHTQ